VGYAMQGAEGVLDVSAARRSAGRQGSACPDQSGHGMAVAAARVREILTGLGAEVGGTDAELSVTAPVGAAISRSKWTTSKKSRASRAMTRFVRHEFGLRVAVDTSRTWCARSCGRP